MASEEEEESGPMAIDEADIDKLRETLTGELKKHFANPGFLVL